MILNISYIITTVISVIYINKNIISIGEFFLFNQILLYFNEPLKSILDLYSNINYINNIYNRINDLLIIDKAIEGEEIDNFKGDIHVDKLSFSHDGIKDIFDNVSFDIKYGSKFLIYGKSGNGKSTIIKILLKYLDDYKGDIYIGNVNLKDISDRSILNNMTYVSQHSYVFNDTLKNNIVMNRKITYEEYERVIDICNLNKLRDSKKLRNNFLIEDDGFNISGGERQKIVLARSLLKKSNYIILDEALSEVGIKEEKDIIKKLFNYLGDKTIIYISHKQEIINMFDKKYKLERRR
jgi:ATP-binding cassette subfamily B protein